MLTRAHAQNQPFPGEVLLEGLWRVGLHQALLVVQFTLELEHRDALLRKLEMCHG